MACYCSNAVSWASQAASWAHRVRRVRRPQHAPSASSRPLAAGRGSRCLARPSRAKPSATLAVVALTAAVLMAAPAHAGAREPGRSQAMTAQQASPRLNATDITTNTATLNLTGSSGSWYYKQTRPTEGECSSVIAQGATAALSGLSPGTTYAFNAYRYSSACPSWGFVAGTTFTTAGVVLSDTNLIAPEESQVTYTVRLATAPTADVTVTLTHAGDSDIATDTDTSTAGDQNTIAFTAANWATAQTVTIRASDDTDTSYGSATITHTATSTHSLYNNTTSALNVTEGDNDVCQGTAAVDSANDGTLIDDCNTLLAAKSTLTGTSASLNTWTTSTPIADWLGITIAAQAVSRISLTSQTLDGAIPHTLANLTTLNTLDLSDNSLTGPIPTQLGNLTNLNTLDLSDNSLTGPIPTQLGNLTNLNTLDLSDNSLTGPIPTQLGNVANLTNLDLSYNDLSTTIPAQLGNLIKLQRLDVSFNSLTGAIPLQLGNLTNLQHLYLNRNDLSGAIPVQLGNLTNLIRLWLAGNSVSSAIPPELGNLTNLVNLDLSSNDISGAIPAQLGNLTNLTNLGLTNNNLTGSIPTQLGNLTNLQYLGLSNNNLSGAIPAQLSKLTNVQHLHLNNNSLTGAIPTQLGNLTNLQYLYLFSNSLTGSIPTQLGNLTNLAVLYANDNSLTGSIPTQLGNLTNLSELWLNGNSLTGSIPSQLGNLTGLYRLWLYSNSLSGCVPSNLIGFLGTYNINPQNNSVNLTTCDGIVVSSTRVSVPEGSTADYTVRLATAPTSSTTVELVLTGDSDITTSGSLSSLTFTTGNWSTAQTVTLSAAPDGDNTSSTATITHTATGGGNNYNNITSTVIAIEVDDEAALSADNLTHDSVRLTLTGHTGNWWLKRTTPTDTTCKAKPGTYTENVYRLTASTDYTYGAYSDSDCTTEITTASFTTATAPLALRPIRVAISSATLNLTGHTGNWWLKRTTPTDTTCKTKQSTDSESLTNLDADTNYAYSAYSDSTCTTEIAAAVFTTAVSSLVLTASDVTQNAAILTLKGHSSNWWLKRNAPTEGPCTDKQDNYTENLTGLNFSTLYGYVAYSDSTCTTEISTANFVTLRLPDPKPPTPLPGPFPTLTDHYDDDDDSVFEEFINKITDAGIVARGCGGTQNRFCPDMAVTRAEMAVFLQRAFKLPATNTPSMFVDAAGSAQTAIAAIATAGITLGCNADGTMFCPDEAVSREEMAAFLARALKLPTPDKRAAFDDTADSVFKNAITAIFEARITRGCDVVGRRFCPDQAVTRGQMAAFLARALKL